MSISIGPFVAGEVPEGLEYTFLDSDGVAIDLTGFTATFHLKIGEAEADDLLATVSDPTEGTVTHTWLEGELTAGALRAEFFVENGTNRYASELLTGIVRPPV